MSRYNKQNLPTVPAYDDGKYLGNLTQQEIRDYQGEQQEKKNLRNKRPRSKRAMGGRIEYSKGTMPARNKKNFRPTKSGAGMTRAGVKAYRRLNPGSKLKTAVTGKVKPGSKAAMGGIIDMTRMYDI